MTMLAQVSDKAMAAALRSVGWSQPVSPLVPVPPVCLPVLIVGGLDLPGKFITITSNANAGVAVAGSTFLATPGGVVPSGKKWRVWRASILNALTTGVYPAVQDVNDSAGFNPIPLHQTISGTTVGTPYVYPLPTDANAQQPLGLLGAGGKLGVMGGPAGTNSGHYAQWMIEELDA